MIRLIPIMKALEAQERSSSRAYGISLKQRRKKRLVELGMPADEIKGLLNLDMTIPLLSAGWKNIE